MLTSSLDGGFSALDAGSQVILGVDHDPVPLKLWSANVTGGKAVLATLGKEELEVDFPSPSVVTYPCFRPVH